MNMYPFFPMREGEQIEEKNTRKETAGKFWFALVVTVPLAWLFDAAFDGVSQSSKYALAGAGLLVFLVTNAMLKAWFGIEKNSHEQPEDEDAYRSARYAKFLRLDKLFTKMTGIHMDGERGLVAMEMSIDDSVKCRKYDLIAKSTAAAAQKAKVSTDGFRVLGGVNITPEYDELLSAKQNGMDDDQALEVFVKHTYPQNKFDSIYAVCPKDVSPSLVLDGMSLHGDFACKTLGKASLDRESAAKAYEAAATLTLGGWYNMVWLSALSGVISSLLLSLSVAFAVTSTATYTTVDGEFMPTMDFVSLIFTWQFALATVLGGLLFKCQEFIESFSTLRQWHFTRFRTIVWLTVEKASSKYRKDAFEAIVRSRWRADKHSEYKQAITVSARNWGDETTPVFVLGKTTGRFYFRGALTSPLPNKPMAMSMSDMSEHLLVLGGTGAGKTSQVGKPIISRALDMRASGLPVSLFVTDGKATLWNVVEDEAKKRGLGHHVRVIGPGKGQIRVDLLEGVDPSTFADCMRSVAVQLGGGRGDASFWPQMAHSLVLETAIILQAAEVTAWGIEQINITGKRVYSIQSIVKYACDPRGMLDGPVNAVTDAIQDKEQYLAVYQFDGPALRNAMESRMVFWQNLADVTMTGVVANLRSTLQLFLFNDELSEGFADGSSEDQMPVSEVFDNHLVCTSISTSEHGQAGKLTLVLLKTIFMREARLRQLRRPDAEHVRREFWKSPVDPATMTQEQLEDARMTLYIADEYQELITADANSAYSDATFWNVARSAGVAGIVMVQTLKALSQNLSQETVENFVGNFRSKIMLRLEDTSTISWFCEMSGTTIRPEAKSHDDLKYAHETQTDEHQSPEDMMKYVDWAKHLGSMEVPCFEVAPYNIKQLVPYDDRLTLEQQFEREQAQQEARKRPGGAVDDSDEMANAVQGSPVLEVGDIGTMAFGEAVCLINRGGMLRADIVNMADRSI